MTSVNLVKIIQKLSYIHIAGPKPSEVNIGDVSCDSRAVSNDGLFVAMAGEKVDGHSYVAKVLKKGCAAVIVERTKLEEIWHEEQGICVIAVDDTREVFGDLVAALYNFPQQQLQFIGITGTNGKTTITYLLEKVLSGRGERVGVIGTVNYRYYDRDGVLHIADAPLTTPDPVMLQKTLRKMADAGVRIVLMEVSSHSLAQKRLGNILFDVAVFTNLSHDHLDYHSSMHDYFEAKTRLFLQHLKKSGQAVVTFKDTNEKLENRWPSALIMLLKQNNISYITCGREDTSIIRPLEVKIGLEKTEMAFLTPVGRLSLASKLVGRFNVDNIMTTLGIAAALDADLQEAAKYLAEASCAPGRLERVKLEKNDRPQAFVFVDYAHTPDALLNVLATLQELPHDRLICVFGCGGDRDAAKRPEMGKIAASYADVAIVTDDNPRTEDSNIILSQILEGVRASGMEEVDLELLSAGEKKCGCVVIPDRRLAIHRAVKLAAEDDVVVVAGKGHEKYQLTNQGKRFFDDALEVREALLSWDLDNVADALGIDLPEWQKNRYFCGISTDSREISRDQLFVALSGENFNGHDYLYKAVEAGAGGLVVSQRVDEALEKKLPVYRVPDTLKALGDLAAYRRKELVDLSQPLIVGITGSCGKTTVKEMVASIFEKRWPDSDKAPVGRVLKTKGNFNNLIGLPLSLIPMQLKHKSAVLEMGMNQPGEISRLAQIAGPDISCIVNIRGAHLEGLGSIEGVAKAKEELFQNTDRDGVLVVNLDDPLVSAAAENYDHKKVFFSSRADCKTKADLLADDIHHQENGNIAFKLKLDGYYREVNLQVPGRHNVANGLAAAAIALAADTSADIIVEGLESFQAPDKRLQVIEVAGQYSIINDTYNANPASMEAGLETLESMRKGKKVAILGDMLELGASSNDAHRELGRKAAQSGLDYLVVVGTFAEYIARGAVSAGMSPEAVNIFADKEDIAKWIKALSARKLLGSEDWILVKASRGMQLETVVEQLAQV